VVTKGATVVSRLTDNVILVDAGLHALNSKAYINRIMSDFWDIFISLGNLMLKHIPNVFNNVFHAT